MTTTIAPCKRPKVPVVDNKGTAVAYCLVTGCKDWRYGPGVKTDVEENAKRHRQAHREAVPAVTATDVGAYHVVRCACGHEHRVHGNKRSVTDHIDYHLTRDHGLVA